MHATLVVLIDREREELKNNSNEAATNQDFSIPHNSAVVKIESNTFGRVYQVMPDRIYNYMQTKVMLTLDFLYFQMAYEKAMECLTIDVVRGTPVVREECIHGGLLLLNELLRVSDVKFEVRIRKKYYYR